MGLLTAITRISYLVNTALDLEYKIQLITQTKSTLAASNSDLMNVGTDYDPESPVSKMLAQRMAKLKVLDQKLDNQLAQYKLQLAMVETEKESCMKMLEKHIKSSFSYGF